MSRLPLLLGLPLCLLALPAVADPGAATSLPSAADAAPPTAGNVSPPAVGDANPAAYIHYQFVPHQEDDLTGPEVTVRFIDSGGSATTVVEIPAPTKGLSLMDRAKIIADRLQQASLSDKRFWNTLRPHLQGSQLVVALPRPVGVEKYVVTADKASATLAGYTDPEGYAAFLLTSIKIALMGKLRDAKFDYQLQGDERLERANLYRRQANAAHSQGDDPRTESLLLEAKAVAPDYAVPYLALGNFYLAKGDTKAAQAVLQEAAAKGLNLVAVNSQLNPGANSPAITLFQKLKGSH